MSDQEKTIATESMRIQLAARIDEITDEIRDLSDEARILAEESGCIFMANADAYIFDQLEECLDNSNRYNQSLTTLAEDMRKGGDEMADKG